MSIGQAFIDALIAELRPRYPALPACAVVSDRPTGYRQPDGTTTYPHPATFNGFDANTCALLNFSDGDRDGVLEKEPSRAQAAHELCHALHVIAGGDSGSDADDFDDPVLLGFWRVMHCTTPLADAVAQYARTKLWNDRPSEHLASAFGYMIGRPTSDGPASLYARYGGDYARCLRDGSLKRFFRSLKPLPRSQWRVWRTAPRVNAPTQPTAAPTVEQRIATFWDEIDQLPPDGLLPVADLREWTTLLFERQPAARVMVRDFRAFTRDLQAALDRANGGGG